MKTLFPTLLLLCCSLAAIAQPVNLLKNGSFEDQEEGLSRTPKAWLNCGFPGESPPDILSTKVNDFRVDHEPCSGELYLHMVARDNGTYEQIGQQITLSKGKTYRLIASVAKSKTTLSRSRATSEPVNYDAPLFLRFGGGKEVCQVTDIFHLTELVSSEQWITVDVTFTVEDEVDYFVISAWAEGLGAVNGNVLLDDVRLYEVPRDF